MRNDHSNSFIGESNDDTQNRIKNGLAMLKVIFNDQMAENLAINLDANALSSIYTLLSHMEEALTYEIKHVDSP